MHILDNNQRILLTLLNNILRIPKREALGWGTNLAGQQQRPRDIITNPSLLIDNPQFPKNIPKITYLSMDSKRILIILPIIISQYMLQLVSTITMDIYIDPDMNKFGDKCQLFIH